MFSDGMARAGASATKILAVWFIAAGLAQAQSGNAPDGQERCFGVAEAGENDGIDNRQEPGSSTVDYQGNAWMWVETGTCLRMALPVQADGTPRRGALEPINRDRP